MAVNPNLLTKNQASLETDASGWVVILNCTIARSTAQAANGAASLAITSAASGDMGAGTSSGTSGRPVIVGNQYTATVEIRAATSARTCFVRMSWYNSAGTFLSSSDGSQAANSTSAWTKYSVTATAPANAAYATCAARILATGAGAEVHYADKAGIFPGASSTWQMPIAATVHTAGKTGTPGASTDTASVTPTANALQLLVVATGDTGGAPAAPTAVTGNGLTWVKVAEAGVGNVFLSVWRALGASPSAGAITMTWAAGTDNALWQVQEFTGVDPGGTNGSAAIEQSKTGSANSSTPSVTLDTAVTEGDKVFGAVAFNSTSAAITAGTTNGFLLLGTNDNQGTPSNQRAVEFDGGNTTVNFSSSAAGNHGIIGIELAYDPGVVTHTAAVTAAGTGDLSATAKWTANAAATASGTGALTAAGVRSTDAAATASGTGALTAAGVRSTDAAATASGTGSLSAIGVLTHTSAAVLAGVGDLVARGQAWDLDAIPAPSGWVLDTDAVGGWVLDDIDAPAGWS